MFMFRRDGDEKYRGLLCTSLINEKDMSNSNASGVWTIEIRERGIAMRETDKTDKQRYHWLAH